MAPHGPEDLHNARHHRARAEPSRLLRRDERPAGVVLLDAEKGVGFELYENQLVETRMASALVA